MKQTITFTVNGIMHKLKVSPFQTLLEVIREKLQLTGTKVGCGEGECGACTVLMNGRAVNSCLVLALEAEGTEVITVEGLAKEGHLHPLQESFIEHGAIQCGFCSPGMIMSAKALLDNNPHPTVEQIKKGISGNLCRCTGYKQIIEAIHAVSKK